MDSWLCMGLVAAGCSIDWNTLRQIIAYKILEVRALSGTGEYYMWDQSSLTNLRHEDNEENNSKDLDQLPNEFELNDYKDRIGYSLPPFTIQRIGELLSEPDLYYRTEVKFLRAIEKVVYVTSTVEDFPTTTKKPSGGIRPRSQGEMEVEFLPFTSPAAAAAGTVGGEATTVLPSSSSPVSGIATSAVFTDATDGMLDSGETVMVPPVALGGAPMLSTSDTGVVHLSPQHDPAKLDLLDPMAEGTGKTALLSQQTTELSPNLSPVRSNPDNSREETHAGDDNEPVSPPSLNGKAIKDPSVAEPGDNVATD
ncbi:hypothetical protein EV182_002940, partial [Spiromyces aspiralis]